MQTGRTRKKLVATVGSTKLQGECDEYGAVFLEGDVAPVPLNNRESLWELHSALPDGTEAPLHVRRGEGEHEYVVYLQGEVIHVDLETERDRRLKTLSTSASGKRSSAQTVRAPMPGLLKAFLVGEGSTVHKGEPLCILEAMKMENEIKSPGDFVVKRLLIEAGNAVEKGTVLVELIASGGERG